ncbi:MAG: hypothetical protein JWN53_1509 [Gemmatimonadetes bacterium]|nr:hypothetical protein [Gemmatimonadota bacterium]
MERVDDRGERSDDTIGTHGRSFGTFGGTRGARRRPSRAMRWSTAPIPRTDRRASVRVATPSPCAASDPVDGASGSGDSTERSGVCAEPSEICAECVGDRFHGGFSSLGAECRVRIRFRWAMPPRSAGCRSGSVLRRRARGSPIARHPSGQQRLDTSIALRGPACRRDDRRGAARRVDASDCRRSPWYWSRRPQPAAGSALVSDKLISCDQVHMTIPDRFSETEDACLLRLSNKERPAFRRALS